MKRVCEDAPGRCVRPCRVVPSPRIHKRPSSPPPAGPAKRHFPFVQREQALARREAAVAAREAQLTQQEAALRQVAQQLEAWHAWLRQAECDGPLPLRQGLPFCS